jgi:hypothetical protein
MLGKQEKHHTATDKEPKLMTKKLLTLAVSSALAAGSSIAFAAPFNSYDPRSMAMGGAGVAVANTATAPFFNPSLLAVTHDEDDFAMELPIVGARAYDPDDLEDSVNDFQDANYDTSLDNSITNAENAFPAFTPADLIAAADAYDLVAEDINDLNLGLQSLDDKPIQAELGVATVLGIPSKTFGIAFSAAGSATLGGVVNYEDEQLLNGLQNDVQTFADYNRCLGNNSTNPATCGAVPDLTYIDETTGNVVNPDGSPFDPTNDIESTVDVRGIRLDEIGLSFAREFAINGATFAVGVTPKYVKATVYDYQANANTADNDDLDADDYSKEYSGVNLDVGVAKNYNNGWRTGFVVKNLIKQEYDTYRLDPTTGNKEKTGNSIELKPQARLGVSHTSEWHTVALDVDLTENEPVGFEEASRYVALGGEFNMADWAQLRAGYRMNTVDSARNIASIGFGISPMGIHLDLALAKNSDEIGAAAQFGFRF